MDWMSKRLARRYPHPSELPLAILRGKWTTSILDCLDDRACRYCELRQRLPGLSDKMLTKRLQELSRAGLVSRLTSSVPDDHSPCTLSPTGRTLMPLIGRLAAWGIEHAARYGVRFAHPVTERGESH